MSINTLETELKKAPQSTQDILTKILKASNQEPLKATFLNRAIEAFIEILESDQLVDITSANSNYEVLLAALQTPEAISALTSQDPLAKAKIRGLKVKKELIEAFGGCVSSEEVATILGISPQGVNQRRQRGRLIALSEGKGKYIYPLWQFTENGETLPGLKEVLKILKQLDCWMQITFFLNPHLRLGNKTPLEMLRLGKIDLVVETAIAFVNDGVD